MKNQSSLMEAPLMSGSDEYFDRLFLIDGELNQPQIAKLFTHNATANETKNMAMILNWLSCYFSANEPDGFTKKCLELVRPQDLQIKDPHNKCLLQWASLKNYHQVVKNLMPIIKNAIDVNSDSIKIAWTNATASGFEEICSLLMPCLNYQDIHEHSAMALNMASERNFQNTVRAVLDYKSRIQESMNLSQREQLACLNAEDKHVILMALDMEEREVLKNLVGHFRIAGLENSREILQKALNERQMRVTQWLCDNARNWELDQRAEVSIVEDVYNTDMEVFKYIFNELSPLEKECLKKHLAALPPKTYMDNRQAYLKLNYLMARGIFFDSNQSSDLTLFSNIMREACLQEKFTFLKTFLLKINWYLGWPVPVVENFIKQMPKKFSFEERWSMGFLSFMKWLLENVRDDNIRKMTIEKAVKIVKNPQISIAPKMNALLFLVEAKLIQYQTSIEYQRGKKMPLLNLVCEVMDMDLLQAILRSDKDMDAVFLSKCIRTYLQRYMNKNDQYICKKVTQCISLLIDKIEENSHIQYSLNTEDTKLLTRAYCKASRSRQRQMHDKLERLAGVCDMSQDALEEILHIACDKGYLELVRFVIKIGVNIHTPGKNFDRHSSSFNNTRALFKCKKRDVGIEILKVLLDHKVLIFKHRFNCTYFCQALRMNNIEAMMLLLSHPHSVEQLKNGTDSFKNDFFTSIIKNFPKIGMKNARDIMQKLIKYGIKDVKIDLYDHAILSNFYSLYHRREFLFPLLDQGLNLIFIEGDEGNTDETINQFERFGGLIAQLKRSNKMPLTINDNELLIKKRNFLELFPYFESMESNLFLINDYGDSFELPHSTSTKLLSDLKIPKKKNRQERLDAFVEKIFENRETLEQLLQYRQAKASEVRALDAADLELIRKAIINEQFRHMLLKPSVRHLLLINKLGMWAAYQETQENKGLIELRRRHQIGKFVREERVDGDVVKKVNEFLTYGDIMRLRNHSIVFGRFGMQAISQDATQSISGDGGRAQKRQRVGSSIWRDEDTVPRLQNTGASSSTPSTPHQ